MTGIIGTNPKNRTKGDD